MDVTTIGDVMDNATDKPFTMAGWKRWIYSLHESETGERPTAPYVNARAREIRAVVRQIPHSIITAAKKPPSWYTPKTGDTVALACPRGDEEENEGDIHYAIKNPPNAQKNYHAMWKDSMGSLHETDCHHDFSDFEPHPIEWWVHKRWDKRACGPVSDSFPQMDGWLLNGEAIRFDELHIKSITKALTYKKFKKPASETTWAQRLNPRQNIGGDLPWSKIWKRRSIFATPRDKFTATKLLYRNLYVAKTHDDPNKRGCLACDEVENMLHLAECDVIRQEFWNPILKLLHDTGMKRPRDITIFLITGTINPDSTISKYHSVIWYLAWRCLYAAIVKARIDEETLDLDKALKRVIAMLIGRLRAFGRKWKDWVHAGMHHKQPHIIPMKHRNKKILTQDDVGNYEIHDAIWDLASDLGLRSP
jgi:hypothetical protein